jgi:K+-transporting ATPase KdpF subunit
VGVLFEWIAGIVGIVVIGYLLVALVHPERF